MLRNRTFKTTGILGLLLGMLGAWQDANTQRPGFRDTPYLPGEKWRVHDPDRPRAPVVRPGGATSGPPPADAITLFNGADLSEWVRAGDGGEAAWKVEQGYMEVVPESGSIASREHFGDCQIHLEWAAPEEIQGEGQGRGNSGVLIMGYYEIQILDSYQNPTYADGQAAAMYGQYPPLVNASLPPGQWQSYDIIFEAPRFTGQEIRPAYVTVLHNGVLVHHRRAFMGRVVWREVAGYEPHPPRGPLVLQDHGNPVRFRNIWVREL